MKYIFTCLSLFLLALSINVYAQTNNPSEINIENIQGVEGELPAPDSTIDSLSDAEKAKVFSCTNEFTNLSIDINANYSEFISGTVMQLSGEIQNDSDKVISNGTLYIKVLNVSDSEYGLNTIDHFVVQENISIPVNSSLPMSFDWNIPATAPTGSYKIAAYLYIDNKFDAAGISSTKELSGGSFDFTVNGEEDGGVYFDESTIKINEKSYEGLSPVVVQNSGEILFSVDVDNTSTQDQNIQIDWKVYKGDSKNPENLINAINSDATILADSAKNVEFQFSDSKFPLYYIVGELSYKDSKSIVEIQYIREGTSAVGIFSSSIGSYPLIRGDNNTISTCVSNIGSNTTIQNGKILIELKNSNGRVVESYEYKGPITVEAMGVKKDFKASRNLDSFSLHTSVWIEDALIDESVVQYDCNVLNAGNCKSGVFENILYPIAGFLLILLLLVVAIKINRSKNTPLALFMLLICATLFINPSLIEAKSVSSSATVGNLNSGGYPSIAFTNASLSVTYVAELRYVSNNALVADNTSIPVGTQLKIVTSAAVPSHTARNSQYSTYPVTFYSVGSWVTGAGAPSATTPFGLTHGYSATNACGGQYYRTYTNNMSGLFVDGWSNDTNKFYLHPTVNPPTKTITTSGNLSCGTFNSSGVATCTVNGGGAIQITVGYSATSARYYHARHQRVTSSAGFTQNTDQCTPSTWTFYPGPTSLAARSIVFNISGVPVTPVNNPPTAPVIGGPTVGNPVTPYTFTFRGTDADEDDGIRYGIDWDNNGTVDEWSPVSVYVNSGTTKSSSKSWSTIGAKTFRALTQDKAGLNSGWTSRTITLSNPLVNGSCGSTVNSCTNGDLVNTTDSSTEYLWSCNGSNGGTSAPCSLPIPPPVVNGACGVSNNSCTIGTLFDRTDSSTEYLWTCRGENGGTNDPCSTPITVTGPFSVSCSAPTILPGEQATFTATPVNNTGAVTYQWKEEDGTDISGATNSSFSRTYNNVGSYLLNISATNQSVTDTDFCRVTVGCDSTHFEGKKASACISNSEDVYTCTSSGWTTTPQVCTPDPEPSGTFNFNPSIVSDASGTCRMSLNVENVSSCRLIKGGATYTTSPPLSDYLSGTSISASNIPIPIGRYSLECVGTGSTPVTKTLGVQACIVNPNIRED